MVNRRTFLSLVAGSMAVPGFASAQPSSRKVVLYANVGADLTHYDVDVGGAELIKRETVSLPAAVQYAWPHASRRYLYVATSSSAPGYGTQGTDHHVTALAIDPSTGALTPHGTPIRLPTRPDPHLHGYPLAVHPGRLQQPQFGARLPHKPRLHARRGSEAARPDRRRHLCPSGAGDPRQPAGDPGNPRQRSHPDKAGRSGRAEGLRLQGRRAEQRSVDRPEWRKRVRAAAP
jgi:hypothetical protein